MRTLLTLSGLLLIFYSQSQSNVLCIPQGNAVTIDGLVDHSEWGDSDSLELGTTAITKVYYKHDMNNLLVAYVGNLQSASRIPEILIDTEHDKSGSWQADDWWFHVSAQDCEAQGAYANYDSCAVVRPNWSASENMAAGPPSPPFNDTIEIEIPFSTININPSSSDTVGLSLLVTNLFSSWIHWPAGTDRNIPTTWGSIVFDCSSANLNTQSAFEKMRVSPNPSNGIFTISLAEHLQLGEANLNILDQSGRVIAEQPIDGNAKSEIPIDLSGFQNGIYVLQLSTGEISFQEKVVVQH